MEFTTASTDFFLKKLSACQSSYVILAMPVPFQSISRPQLQGKKTRRISWNSLLRIPEQITLSRLQFSLYLSGIRRRKWKGEHLCLEWLCAGWEPLLWEGRNKQESLVCQFPSMSGSWLGLFCISRELIRHSQLRWSS